MPKLSSEYWFFETINFPFNDNVDEAAISVDNPLDKQRSKMRVCITKSLKENVVYNQNRQKTPLNYSNFQIFIQKRKMRESCQ